MSNKKNTHSIIGLLGYVCAGLFVAICFVTALTSAIHVPTSHIDGAFQTASGLFRLDSGQLPGKNFYPYLGIGPLLALFPIYKILGGNLAATVAAAKFLTLFLSWIAIATLWHFTLRPAKLIHSIVGGALILFGIGFLSGKLLPSYVLLLGFEPGNSLRPIRAALPYLTALSIYFLTKNISPPKLRNLSISAVLGITLLWSNDFALPTFGLFFIFIVFYQYFFERKKWIGNSLMIAITSIIVYFSTLSIITAGHSFTLIKYNFLDVAKDQWWYFGPYEPSTRVFKINQLSRLFTQLSAIIYFPIIVILAVFLFSIKTRSLENWLIFTTGLTLFAGGSLASVGGHLEPGYFGGFYFWAIVTSFIFLLKVAILLTRGIKPYTFFRPCRLNSLCLLAFGIILGTTLQVYKNRLKAAQSDPGTFYVDEFGAYLGIGFRQYIDYARQNHEYIAVEDYWGLWNSLNRRFPPWPVDSVIHALGNVREVARESLKSADLIITTRYSMSPEWQQWVLSQNYWFYDDLISNWEPVFTSPTTIVWMRSHRRSAFESATCHVSNDKSSITLPQSEPGFYKVTIGYSSVGKKGRHLLMFRNNISYGADAAGFLSLMPGSHTATFPLLLSREETDVFNLKVVGEAHAEISFCAAERILYENDELLRKINPEDFFLTDMNWINGIARHWAGFFTRNTEMNRTKFKAGNTVIFTNGNQRTILSSTENGEYLNIRVDGKILNHEDVGFPSKFEVAQ